MATFKLVISDPKSGLSAQREVKDKTASALLGMKVGDKLKGELIDLTGYEFEVSGGSDYCGFPMRKDVHGTGRKKILAVQGVGLKKVAKGIKQRKTVCGNTIHAKISQINLKILTQGKEKIVEAKAKEGEKKAEEKKPEPKKEEPKKEEKPKEAPKKEEPKPEKK
ncbi:MAG: 30S ribosomal protein S6e [bacterium]|nr:30S ribosomal protein S6e [bacterium]